MNEPIIAAQRLYLTADKQTVVGHNDPAAAYLLAAVGQEIPARVMGFEGKEINVPEVPEHLLGDDVNAKPAKVKRARKAAAAKADGDTADGDAGDGQDDGDESEQPNPDDGADTDGGAAEKPEHDGVADAPAEKPEKPARVRKAAS